MGGYIVDNSTWGRLDQCASVSAAVDSAAARDVFFSCTPQRLEFLFSARNATDYRTRLNYLDDVTVRLDDDPAVGRQAELIQQSLASTGRLRSVGAFDIMIAAYAYLEQATILHYDSDFDTLNAALPDLKTEWIVPRGTV